MQDLFKRKITYLRLSLTELCNLRCRYCMSEDGIQKKEHPEMLREEEIIAATRVCAKLGISKVRFTGGEPLIKKNILSIVENIGKIDGIQNMAITTNGILLPKFASDLKSLGIKSVNISLDTLNREKFKTITRRDLFDEAFNGLLSAIKEGFDQVKVNTVLIGGFNDDEIEELGKLTLKYPIDVRFIELMPMMNDPLLTKKSFIKGEEVLKRFKGIKEVPHENNSVARLYKLDGALGRIGLISPVYDLFCHSCNRIRLTADGHIKPCLHSKEEFSIKGKSEEEMEEIIKKAILSKPREHEDLTCSEYEDAFTTGGRTMNRIGG